MICGTTSGVGAGVCAILCFVGSLVFEGSGDERGVLIAGSDSLFKEELSFSSFFVLLLDFSLTNRLEESVLDGTDVLF